MRRVALYRAVAALAAAPFAAIAAVTATPFESVEDQRLSPLPFLENRHSFPGIVGMALFDMDGDGDLDLFVTNGAGLPNYLYRNDGHGHFVDIAAEAGVQFVDSNCTAAAVGDFDNDGRLDLLVARQDGISGAGTTPVYLRNRGPDRNGITRFTDESEAVGFRSLPADFRALGFAVADFDLDGRLDVYVAGYDLTEGTDVFDVVGRDDPNRLLHNRGKRKALPRFVDVTERAGVKGTLAHGRTPETANVTWYNHTFVVYASDVNRDGYPDILALNDVPGGVDLFLNNGDMTFTLAQREALGLAGGWMGIASADYNGDGFLDYFVTNLGGEWSKMPIPVPSNFSAPLEPGGTPFHLLLKGSASGTLVDAAAMTTVTPSAVLPPASLAQYPGLQPYEFGWGAAFFDADNRGWDDLYWVGIHFAPMPLNGIGRFLHNNTDGSFSDHTAERGLFNVPKGVPAAFDRAHNGYAVLSGDIDGDGDLDLIVVNGNDSPAPAAPGGVRVFLNPGNPENDHVKVVLEGKTSNRYGLGARVEVITFATAPSLDGRSAFTASGVAVEEVAVDEKAAFDGALGARRQVKEMVTTTGAFSGTQPLLHFGLGRNALPFLVKVVWPNGNVSARLYPRGTRQVVIKEKD